MRSSYRNCNPNCTESVEPSVKPCKIPDAPLVIWRILHLVPWYRNIWYHFSSQDRSCSGTIFRFSTKTLVYRNILFEYRASVPGKKCGGFRHWSLVDPASIPPPPGSDFGVTIRSFGTAPAVNATAEEDARGKPRTSHQRWAHNL